MVDHGAFGLAPKRLRYGFSRFPEFMEIPSLIELQKQSYDDFLQKDVPWNQRKREGLQSALMSFFPIQDFSERAQLDLDYYVVEPCKFDIDEVRQKGLTYASSLKVHLRLTLFETIEGRQEVKEVKEQDTYLGDVPIMTPEGTFIINGVERVVVSQIQRSPGVFFDKDSSTHGVKNYVARVIPFQGAWIDFEFSPKDLLYVRIDRKRKFLATTLMMALASDNKADEDDQDPWLIPGMSRSEILHRFYEVERWVFNNGEWVCDFNPKGWHNVILTQDLVDADSGEVVVRMGERLTQRVLSSLQKRQVKSIRAEITQIIGRCLATDLFSSDTGERLGQAGEEITKELLEKILHNFCAELQVLSLDHISNSAPLCNTLLADKNVSRKDALEEIYSILRPGENATLEIMYTFFQNLFFNPERYSLAEVGRLKMNARLSRLTSSLNQTCLCKEDFIEIIRYLLELKDGKGFIDDIDSLGNRRVRSVGELLEAQYRSGLLRMQRGIRERMNAIDLDQAMPNDFVNARAISSVIKEFFGTSQLSQFMDQTNPLSSVNHKRRLSALGPGGLTKERAGIDVRDVNPSQHGRICPVETPEGGNIGLINSMAVYARVNKYGFLETPYRRVIDGRVTQDVVYVSVMEEEDAYVAQPDADLDEHGYLKGPLVRTRKAGEYVLVPVKDVNFIDVSPKQIVSVAAALIPFLENNDANRALMGSNMQRQAVPLMKSQAPLIGTGLEALVARDSGAIIHAKRSGIVDSVDARRIVIIPDTQEEDSLIDIYKLTKFRRSNSGTCIHQKPVVMVGQKVMEGSIIADGCAMDQGELALGSNVLVAFMPWYGYGFEDSIIISNRLIKEDAFTTLHIEELEVIVRDTKLGAEEITIDVPGVPEEMLARLDQSGIIHIGREVEPGDILVGKVSPRAETTLSSEEKLLRAIFADKASDVKDSSLRVPSGMRGVVCDVQIFCRAGVEKDERALIIEQQKISRLIQEKDVEKELLERIMKKNTQDLIFKYQNRLGIEKCLWTPEIEAGRWRKFSLDPRSPEGEQLELLRKKYTENVKELEEQCEQKVGRVSRGDELPAGVLKIVKVFLAVKRKLQPGDKMAGRHGNKGVVSVIVPQEDMPYLEDGTPVDVVLNSLGLPSRMNVGQTLETHLGWASLNFGKKVNEFLKQAVFMTPSEGELHLKNGLCEVYKKQDLVQKIQEMPLESLMKLADGTRKGMPMATPVFEGAKVSDIEELFQSLGLHSSGQERLYDGKTGEPFDRPVTVGIMYMLKLDHLVDDKIHARSVGPYGLVTQQPLGGKSQFGGQRFGEMEVWALQAYGAAKILAEMITVKSDDLEGRMAMFKSIIKNMESSVSTLPESFNVLVKELRTLCLNVEYVQKDVIGCSAA
ncbi:DNA-directed RNA polymerase subunit beta [Holospora obtusa F1]|uniref:DNA-directed RNA polymerase subunit beta n=1 Tax=Holospora obtusa F1 TaxID=1399147 RepID=W6TDR9_HOLOB|nr:DNA-directed RNA polymerase subunit beta [Holospora obtusa]ETZ06749.1 DNA-directed RNA polymerase subunit beta [Holospora obtusa F1]